MISDLSSVFPGGYTQIVAKGKIAAGVLGLMLVSTGGAYWKMSRPVPAYEILRVIDGDTFETKERQLIRLAHVNAPDLNLCKGKEAKQELEKLVAGKPVYIKVLYRDRYMRLLGLVYTTEGFVNEKMAKSGLAVYRLSGPKSEQTEILQRAAKIAVENKSGVYGSECTQEKNSDRPGCVIKGNIRGNGSKRIYSMPGCESYASTLVQLHLGDRWFCSEKEAAEAGFERAGGCENPKW